MQLMKGLWLSLAVGFTVLTVMGFVLVRRLEWAPQTPFDIIGFLWIHTNLGPLLAATAVLACGVCAVYFWLRVLEESL
jgi:hypothetical protein